MKYASKLAAVVFDFDGVIVNTEPLHFLAFREILETKGLALNWKEYVSHYLGLDDRSVFQSIFKREGRRLRKENLSKLLQAKTRLFQKLIEERGVRPFPGVIPLIQSLAHTIPLALCSGAVKSDIEPILRKLKCDRVFDVIVTAEDVSVSKPNPASYLLALKCLRKVFPSKKIIANHCVAIEDTPEGIDAARGAGLLVLALSNSYAPVKLKAASKIAPSLKGITKNVLARLIDLAVSV